MEKNLARCVSVLGTASDVGKSVVATALCRIFSDLGIRVVPFKAQNMSNNSFVTLTGDEMGRAQIAQAEAARLEPHSDMNPVLLKPSGDTVSQVVLHGKPSGNMKAADYFKDTQSLFKEAVSSLDRLRLEYDLVVMEGAGSCAEVNLKSRDFVNFRVARAAGAPVILVADIDRGGVFAQIVGTLAVLPEEDRELIRAIIINRFRGDSHLFDDGIKYIERQTGLPVLGLIPFFRDIEIDSEDGVPLEAVVDPSGGPMPDRINIAVIRLPHISNFTDFAPLGRESLVDLHYLAVPRALRGYDLVLLPGTKNTLGDMEWLRKTGWDDIIYEYVDSGEELGGVCGGYQMLGREIHDPHGIEGTQGKTAALGLLDTETTIKQGKVLRRSAGVWIANGEHVHGYEIHMGLTPRPQGLPAAIRLTSPAETKEEGACTPDGKIWGTYFHGLFDTPGFRQTFLKRLRPELTADPAAADEQSAASFKDRQYDLLADHFRAHLDMDRFSAIVGLEAKI